jgi:hypothetical protein
MERPVEGLPPREAGNPVSATATTMILFATIMMVILGAFHVLSGVMALIEGEFYEPKEYFGDFSIKAWGWIHILLGGAAVVAGLALLRGALWARITVGFIAFVSSVVNFAFLPHYPAWSLVMIALSLLVIWAVVAHGDDLQQSGI